MKKITAILLSLMLAASMFSVAFTVVATDDGIDWERYLALSADAELDEEASSIQAGQVTFKVTLPVEGYAQFQQPLRSLISYDSLNNAEKVTIVVGDGTKAEYNYSMLQVQLVGSADASTDIVPVDEANGEDPGTQALTWHLYGPQDLNDPIVSTAYGLNKGCSTRSGAQFTHFSNIENHHLQLLFTEETDGHVTVSQPYGAQYPNNYAYRKCASTYTLDDLNAEDGVYFRIRNNDPDAEITYTVTIQSADVTTAYRDGDFILTEGSSLANSSVSASDGKTNYTFTSTLAPEGYIQFDKKLTDLADDAIAVQVVVGNGTASDYEMTNVNVQLTADATGAQNINLVNEYYSTPDTTGMTWIFQNYSNMVYFNTGANLGGSTTLATPENTASTGLRLNFTKDEDGYVTATYQGIANKAKASKRTLTEIGGDDGVYVRIRNNASQEITYTVTVAVASQPYTDGLYKFSDEACSLNSSSSVANLEGVKETATVTLSPNGGYVQLDKKLSEMNDNEAINVKVIVGDGTSDDYAAANVNVQLTADSTGEIKIPIQNEYLNTPDTTGMTWIFQGYNNMMYFNTGGYLGGATTLATPANTASTGLRLNFTKDEDGYVTATYQGIANKAKASKRTLTEIGGDDGVYVRIRNNASTAVTYTVIVSVAGKPHTDGHYKFSDQGSSLVSSSTSFDGQNIVETATLTLSANGGYAQLDRTLGDMIQNGNVFVKVVVGDGTSDDYAAANVNVQLTADSTGEIKIPIENEYLNTPDTTGMTWIFQGYNNMMYFNTGGYLGGATTLATPANTASTGLRLNFTKDEDGYVTATYQGIANKAKASKRTLTEIGGDDGVYVRIRNNASTAVTYTVIVKTAVIDFDRDGIAGASDLIALQHALLFNSTSEFPEADLNSDDVIDIRDLVHMKKYLVSLAS